eukprot:4209962-Amphidinium_carterae.1
MDVWVSTSSSPFRNVGSEKLLALATLFRDRACRSVDAAKPSLLTLVADLGWCLPASACEPEADSMNSGVWGAVTIAPLFAGS